MHATTLDAKRRLLIQGTCRSTNAIWKTNPTTRDAVLASQERLQMSKRNQESWGQGEYQRESSPKIL